MNVDAALERWLEARPTWDGSQAVPCTVLVAEVLGLLGLEARPGDEVWRDLNVWDAERIWSLPERVAAWAGTEIRRVVLEVGVWHAVQGWRLDGTGHAFLARLDVDGVRVVESSETLGYRDTVREHGWLDTFDDWQAAPLWLAQEVPMSLAEQLLKLLPLQGLADFVLKLVWPLAPAWLSELVTSILALVKTLVDELTSDEYKGLPGSAKLEHVVTVARESLDADFDGLPAWNLLSEEARDRILAGLAELVLLIGRASTPKSVVEPADSDAALARLRSRVR